MQAITWLALTSALVLGMVPALLGSLRPALAKHFGVGEARIGGLATALNLSLIPFVLLSGLLVDRWGAAGVALFGCLLLGGALGALAARPSYPWAVGCVLLLGAGTACFGAATVVLLPRAFREFFGARLTASLSLGYVFFALGALMTPTLVDVLLRALDLRRALSVLAVLCVLPAAFVPWSGDAPPAIDVDLGQVLAEPAVWLAGLVLALYVAVEFCVGSWASGYLTSAGMSERRAAWWLSGFWLAFLVGRALTALFYSGLLWDGSEGVVLAVLALAITVVLGDLAGTFEPHRMGLDLLVLGCLLGPVFPLLLGAAFGHCGEVSGTAYGVVFAFGSTGSLVLAPVIAARSRHWTIQKALRIPLVLAVLLICAALVLALA